MRQTYYQWICTCRMSQIMFPAVIGVYSIDVRKSVCGQISKLEY